MLDGIEEVSDKLADCLQETAKFEIDYAYSIWRGDYQKAYENCVEIYELLEQHEVEFKPYRAFWAFLGSKSAYLEFDRTSGENWKEKHNSMIKTAKNTVRETRWLPSIEISQKGIVESKEGVKIDVVTDTSFILEELSSLKYQSKKFKENVEEVLEWLSKDSEKDSKKFERALEKLGKLLGFRSKNYIGQNGAPDGIWALSNNRAFVFEAKSNKDFGNAISLKDVREAKTHPDWVLKNDNSFEGYEITPIFLTNQDSIKSDARSVADGIGYMKIDDLKGLFSDYLPILKAIRSHIKNLSLEHTHYEIYERISNSRFTLREVSDQLMSKKLTQLDED